MSEIVDKILDNVDIIDVVSPYVEDLKPTAEESEWKGLCPFHSEKTPSFFINPDEHGIYHCFGCGADGNIITFLEEIEDKDFFDVMQELSELTGIEFVSTGLSEEEKYNKHLQEIMVELSGAFNFALTNMKTHRATYEHILKKRKLNFSDLKTFDLGYSDKSILNNFMQANNVSVKDKVATGSYRIDKETGDVYPTINSRITFPLKRLNGDIVGFTGERTLSDDLQPQKYKISVPKGINQDYFYYVGKLKKRQPFYLCEGLYDVISLKLAGVTNAISTLGTSVTDEQIERLLEQTNKFVLCYDGDRAGMNAAKKIYQQIKRLDRFDDVDIKFIFIPKELDPDDFRKRYGLKLFTQLVEQPVKPVPFMLELLEVEIKVHSNWNKADIIKRISSIYTMFSTDDIEKSVYFNELSSDTNIDKQILEDYGKKEFEITREKNEKHKNTPDKMFTGYKDEPKQNQAQSEPKSKEVKGNAKPNPNLIFDIGSVLNGSSDTKFENTSESTKSLDELEEETNSILFLKEKSILNYLIFHLDEIRFINDKQVFFHSKIKHFFATLKNNYVKLNSENKDKSFYDKFNDFMMKSNSVDSILWEDIKNLNTLPAEFEENVSDLTQHGVKEFTLEQNMKKLDKVNNVQDLQSLMEKLSKQ